MSNLITNCARCDAMFRMPVAALLLAPGDADIPGRVAYICPTCNELVDEPLPIGLTDALVSAGAQIFDVGGAGQ